MVDRRPPRGTRRLWSWARRATVPVVCVVTVVALGRTGALVDAEIINVKVTRSIDATSIAAKHDVRVTMQNAGTAAESSFFLAFPAVDAVGDVVVTRGDEASPKPLTVNPVEAAEGPRASDAVTAASAAGASLYRVSLPDGLGAGATEAVRVRYNIGDSLTPVPATLRQGESQYVRWSGAARWMSPYATRKIVTTVTVSPSGLTSMPTEPSPVSVSGPKVTAGPYVDVPAYGGGSFPPLRLRFLLNQPMVVADRFVKTITVSHTGPTHVREAYWLSNAAATHEGPWSRLDYARSPGATSPTALHSTWLRLPSAASDVQYRDLIGNVTSSRLRLPRAATSSSTGGRPLMLTLRYPMVGGWKDHFWVDYTLPMSAIVRTSPTDPSRHSLELLAYGSSWATELPVRDMELRVALPALASVLAVSGPTGGGGGGAGWAISQDNTPGTLSPGGRPTLVFRATHVASGSASTVVPGASPTDKVVIHYFYGLGGLLAAPAAVAAALVTALTALLVARRTHLSLTPPSAGEMALTSMTNNTLVTARKAAGELAAVLLGIDDHVSRGASTLSRDWPSAAVAEVAALDADARRHEAELVELSAQLAVAASGGRKAPRQTRDAVSDMKGLSASSGAVAAARVASARIDGVVRKCAAKREALARAAARRQGVDVGEVDPTAFAEECRDVVFPIVDGLTGAIDTAVRDMLDC
ncbi:hypothetical protein I4F81_011044 [Pyropia yezoensis]|uniref:Uncharacterized protein n=1 Tax=Pyropia yezoensis TaxID=2788 RepID=A0ACC3CEB5_PYRYE|nr:hypothetical protein I4F81_011044 [Neopyropia yezoensis]